MTSIYEAVYAAIDDEDLDDHLVETLARGYPLISGIERGQIPEPTRTAMHAAAAVGYFTRAAEAERGLAADGLPRPRGVPSEELGELAAEFARDATIDDAREALRERTLSIVVREGDSGRLITPAGDIADATLDDFHRVWMFGFVVGVLGEEQPLGDPPGPG